MIPKGVYLTSYPGESTDLPAGVMQDIFGDGENDKIDISIAHVYKGLASVGQDQSDLEANKYNGEYLVVL